MNFLKLVSSGHASNKQNPLASENKVSAGLPFAAHINDPKSAAHETLDRVKDHAHNINMGETVRVVTGEFHDNVSTPVHTWENKTVKTLVLDHVPIPWMEHHGA